MLRLHARKGVQDIYILTSMIRSSESCVLYTVVSSEFYCHEIRWWDQRTGISVSIAVPSHLMTWDWVTCEEGEYIGISKFPNNFNLCRAEFISVGLEGYSHFLPFCKTEMACTGSWNASLGQTVTCLACIVNIRALSYNSDLMVPQKSFRPMTAQSSTKMLKV